MTGCSDRGDLVGGYVLGALEPAEMEEMRRHVAECPLCETEARELGTVPGLLELIEPADVPPPVLTPEVEEAVLDRFARERRRRRPARRHVLTTRRIGALAAACAAALALALAFAWPDGDDQRAYARAELTPTAGYDAAAGMAYARDVPAGTHVSLWARGLRPAKGVVYELYCIRADGHWVSGGTFQPRENGHADAELTAAVRPGDYDTMIVTRHAQRALEGEHGATVLRGRLKY